MSSTTTYNVDNILPGLGVTADTSQIAQILNSIQTVGANAVNFSYSDVASALKAYREQKYSSATSDSDTTSYSLATNNDISNSEATTNTAYQNMLEAIKNNITESDEDDTTSGLSEQQQVMITNSIASADLYYTGSSNGLTVEAAAGKYLGYIFAAQENGYDTPISPIQKDTGADAMLFCRQVLNDIGIKWVSRYIDYAIQEAVSASLLISWPYSGYPSSIEAYKALSLSKQKELENKAYNLISTPLLKDTDLSTTISYDDTTRNPYYLENGDIIISPDKKSAAIVISDQSIYQCTNRTILDCPYLTSDYGTKCPESGYCLSRQCILYDNGEYSVNKYGDGKTKYNSDDPNNTGGINISNDPRNECVSSLYSFKTLQVVHDDINLRRLVFPWYSYIIKTSELVNKLSD